MRWSEIENSDNVGNKSTREYDKQAKKERILSSTRELIQKVDVNRLTTKAIAKEAGVSIGLLYSYYKRGLIDILKDLSKNSSKSVLSATSLKELQGLSFEQAIHQLLIKNLTAHQKSENFAMLLALESFYLLNKEKFPNFQDFLYIDWEIIRKMIEKYNMFQHIPEKELKSRISNTLFFIDALVHRYLLFDSPFENDQQFLDFLTRLTLTFLVSGKKSSQI